MPHEYRLPEKHPQEDNWAWCQRAAASIPAEVLAKRLLAFIDKDRRRGDKTPLWSKVGMAMDQGSGVSAAIVERLTGKREL
jgi:hypothetical protein